jgi:hypothetical protein
MLFLNFILTNSILSPPEYFSIRHKPARENIHGLSGDPSSLCKVPVLPTGLNYLTIEDPNVNGLGKSIVKVLCSVAAAEF